MANDIDKKCPECGAKMTYTPADVTEGLWGCTQCNYQVSSETDKDLELLREHCPELADRYEKTASNPNFHVEHKQSKAIAAEMIKQYKLILACKTAFNTCRDTAKEIKDMGDSYDPYELITNANYIIETCKKILKEADESSSVETATDKEANIIMPPKSEKTMIMLTPEKYSRLKATIAELKSTVDYWDKVSERRYSVYAKLGRIWAKAVGKEGMIPDTGKLLDWLAEYIEQLETALDDMLNMKRRKRDRSFERLQDTDKSYYNGYNNALDRIHNIAREVREGGKK